jgi:hypothetical protein
MTMDPTYVLTMGCGLLHVAGTLACSLAARWRHLPVDTHCLLWERDGCSVVLGANDVPIYWFSCYDLALSVYGEEHESQLQLAVDLFESLKILCHPLALIDGRKTLASWRPDRSRPGDVGAARGRTALRTCRRMSDDDPGSAVLIDPSLAKAVCRKCGQHASVQQLVGYHARVMRSLNGRSVRMSELTCPSCPCLACGATEFVVTVECPKVDSVL